MTEDVWAFLKPRFLSNRPAQFLSTCDGWAPLIKRMVDELDALCLKELGKEGKECWEVLQCKEKFAELCFYFSFFRDMAGSLPEGFLKKFREIVGRHEEESSRICEDCGKEGSQRSTGYWLVTRCDEHFQEVMKRHGS